MHSIHQAHSRCSKKVRLVGICSRVRLVGESIGEQPGCRHQGAELHVEKGDTWEKGRKVPLGSLSPVVPNSWVLSDVAAAKNSALWPSQIGGVA